jgi:two-component system, cell cycle response regulator
MSGRAAMKILLAEDDAVSRLLMRRTLESFGYEVLVAQNGRNAAEILCEEDGPRLALIDWMMPELDGLAVCQEVRNRQAEGSYVYVVLLTSKQDSEDIVAGLEAGADDYLTKPCHPAELKARLHTGLRILSLERKLVQAREEMRERATRDSLTGLWNRASILSLAHSEVSGFVRERSGFSLILCDVDHFKPINDAYGHLTGDHVLKEIATRLASAVRAYDAVGRYGGEEFLILLNDCDQSALQSRADVIRSTVSSRAIEANGHSLNVTISIGAVACEGAEAKLPLERILARADAALYEAKHQGRNRSIVVRPLTVDECNATHSDPALEHHRVSRAPCAL